VTIETCASAAGGNDDRHTQVSKHTNKQETGQRARELGA